MKFVDETVIHIEAGKGGSGCLSFRREKYIPRGGPDGGDGGDGGSIYLVADPHVSTLVDFRYKRRFKATNGQPGMGKQRRGKSGENLDIPVPIGTTVYDASTKELIGDLVTPGARLLVAQGGYHGLGNARFKSSTNRTPRQTTEGSEGEVRDLHLELKLLADVGLLGLPNAGKSTLISAISNATPKVADYPFTTLHPQLGVVRIEDYKSFVVADIPGLIEGASQGAGLGLQFLKHLSRTQVLLHLVDIAPLDNVDPVEAITTIFNELQQYSKELSEKERWLVLNKIDLLDESELQEKTRQIIEQLDWKGPVYQISAATKVGLKRLCLDLYGYIEEIRRCAT